MLGFDFPAIFLCRLIAWTRAVYLEYTALTWTSGVLRTKIAKIDGPAADRASPQRERFTQMAM